MKANRLRRLVVVVVLLGGVSSARAAPLGTGFTYQGQLKEGGSPASGLYDLRFRLYDASAVGTQVGTTICANNVSVTNGLFTVPLDFGSQFNGDQRFLEVGVRVDTGLDCANFSGFVTLAPRQSLSATPYALKVPGIDGHSLDASDGLPVDQVFVDNNGNVGIGTDTPLANLHVAGETGALRVDANDNPESYLLLEDRQPTQGKLMKFNSAGDVLLDVNPMPLDGAGNGVVRFFRETNTTGSKRVDFFRGNNTTGTSASIGVDGANSYFQLQGGNVGIGTTTPAAKLHVVEGAGGGNAIQGINTGTGRAGLFQISNAANNEPALYATTNGTGPGLRVQRGSDYLEIDEESINSEGTGVFGDPLFLNDVTSNNVLIGFGGGNVGIGGGSAGLPLVRLHVDGGTGVSVNGGGGYLQLGSSTGIHVAMDNNEIMARSSNAASTLHINRNGGDVVFGGAIDIGYEIVTSQACFDAGNGSGVDVFCPAGKRVLGGGCRGSPADGLTTSLPIGATGWSCRVNGDCDPLPTAHAICANVK